MKRLKLLIYLIYCFEAGLFLLVAPWTGRWEQNLYFDLVPRMRDLFLNPYVRGAISGVGLLHILLGVFDLLNYRLTLEEI